MLLTAALWPAVDDFAAWPLVFGILLVAGGFMPIINGMLYKIVTFLAWMHLQHQGQMRVAAPNMNRLLADLDMQRQMQVHALALVLLLGAVFFPAWLARPAGLALALASGWLWRNLWLAACRYRQHGIEIREKLAAMA
jgi:hypothetical protein